MIGNNVVVKINYCRSAAIACGALNINCVAYQ